MSDWSSDVCSSDLKVGEDVVGNATRVKVVKNKVAPPFKQVEFDIMYGAGISLLGEIIDLGVKAGIVEKSGAWYSFDSIRLGQCKAHPKNFLRDHPHTAKRIEDKLLGKPDELAETLRVGGDASEDEADTQSLEEGNRMYGSIK